MWQRYISISVLVVVLGLSGCCWQVRSSFLFDRFRYGSDERALKERAGVALSMNSLDYAISLYRKSLKHQPNDDEAYMGIATARFHDGNLKWAIQNARAAVKAGGPNAPFAASTAIYLQTHRGDFAGARDTALLLAQWAESAGQRLIALDSYLLASNLSSAYLGDWEAAERYARSAEKLLQPGDLEAAKRVKACLYDLERRRSGKKFGDG